LKSTLTDTCILRSAGVSRWYL